MTTTILSATTRLADVTAQVEQAKSAVAELVSRLDAGRAAAALRLVQRLGRDDAATEALKELSQEISNLSSHLTALEAARHAAEILVESGADPHEQAIAAGRQGIADALKARAKAEKAATVRARAIDGAHAEVARKKDALDKIDKIKKAAAHEDAAILSAEAADKKAPARQIDRRELRRAEFDATEDLEAAKATLAQVEAEPIGEAMKLADAAIRENVAAVMGAKARGHVSRAAHFRRLALREEIAAHGIVGAELAAPSVLQPLENITPSVIHQMNGPGRRTSVGDAAVVFRNLGVTLAADADADIDLAQAFASAQIWLAAADRA